MSGEGERSIHPGPGAVVPPSPPPLAPPPEPPGKDPLVLRVEALEARVAELESRGGIHRR